RGDPQLGEDLVQVPFDGAGADEQLGRDLRVRPAVARESRDVQLVRREVVARVVAALAHLRAGGDQLAPRALGESARAHRGEALVRRAQLLARVDAPGLAPEPLAVVQPGARLMRLHARERLDRLAIALLLAGDLRSRMRRGAERPARPARARPLL